MASGRNKSKVKKANASKRNNQSKIYYSFIRMYFTGTSQKCLPERTINMPTIQFSTCCFILDEMRCCCNIYFIFWCHGISVCGGFETEFALANMFSFSPPSPAAIIFHHHIWNIHFVYFWLQSIVVCLVVSGSIQFIILWWFPSDFPYKPHKHTH